MIIIFYHQHNVNRMHLYVKPLQITFIGYLKITIIVLGHYGKINNHYGLSDYSTYGYDCIENHYYYDNSAWNANGGS